MKLSNKSQELVDDFGRCANTSGWESDRAGHRVDSGCSAAKKALEKHIARLEHKLKVPKTLKEKIQAENAATPAIDEHAHWETAGGTTDEQNEARFAKR